MQHRIAFNTGAAVDATMTEVSKVINKAAEAGLHPHKQSSQHRPHSQRYTTTTTTTNTRASPPLSTDNMVRVFVTGASGGMGSALVPKLIAAGHTVFGLARSDASASKVEKLGAKAVKGDLTDLDTVATAAGEVDVVIHLAFDHEQAFQGGDFAGACAKDAALIKAMGEKLSSGKIFMFAAGVSGITEGTDETAQIQPSSHSPRYASTEAAFALASQGVRVVQLRLAAVTRGQDQIHPFFPMWIAAAKQVGVVPYPEGGCWTACHYDNAADPIVTAISKIDTLPNPVNLHLFEQDKVDFKDIAPIVASKLGLEAKVVPTHELFQYGAIGFMLAGGTPFTADWTRKELDWKPEGESLVAQLERSDLSA